MPTVIADTLRRINAEGNEVQGAAQNGGMDTELRAVKAARAEISDNELQALIDLTRDETQTTPGLLA